MPHPGFFIVLDGPEGSGKSTQVALLKQKLESVGRSVLLVRDPGTTRVGEQIRSILLNPANTDITMRAEMLLYMAARAQMMAETILPALASGQTVLSDRFVSSTLAYQLGGDGLTADDIRTTADIAINGRWPDLTLILDVPTDVSAARLKPKYQATASSEPTKDRIEQRPPEYHERVRQNYLTQARSMPDRYNVIDATQPTDQVHKDIWSALSRLLK